ncbi:MAG: response regulator [Verrucomicrobiota bacterium]
MPDLPLRVLLIEDDEDDFIITRQFFEEIPRGEYRLDWVATFEEGRQRIALQEHDLYLVDFRLGPDNGLDLLREAVANGCPAPIILLTGLGDRQVDVEAMNAGAADYLVKGQITAALLERSINHSLQRKASEQKLRESEEQYRVLFDCNPHPIWVVDGESLSFLAVNESAIRHYGYSREEFLKMNLSALHARTPQQEVPDSWALREGLTGLWRHVKKNGAIIDVELTSNRLMFQGRPAALILANDVTMRLALEAQLRQSQKMESIGTLAGGIAHDFNNILGIISGYASRFHEEPLDSGRFQQSVDAIEKAVARGAGLVRQILTVARKTEVQLVALDLNAIIEDMVRILGGTFPKTITISLALEPDLPSITADATQIQQALLNLCVNARDAMADGGSLKISTGLIRRADLPEKFSEADPKDYVRISVADTGTGMDEATRARIFEPFFTTKARDRGSGLGLAVVYGTMKTHHGFIDVQSELGRGTTFQLYLPASVTRMPREESLPVAPEASTGGNETLLFVEDEELLLDLMKSLLEEQGYKVFTARDGLEAVQVFKQHAAEIELVIADMGLPKIGGWEVFRRIKEVKPDVKAILASGYLEPNLKTSLLKAGALDFVQKPYIPKEIFERIRRVLDPSAAVSP